MKKVLIFPSDLNYSTISKYIQIFQEIKISFSAIPFHHLLGPFYIFFFPFFLLIFLNIFSFNFSFFLGLSFLWFFFLFFFSYVIFLSFLTCLFYSLHVKLMSTARTVEILYPVLNHNSSN